MKFRNEFAHRSCSFIITVPYDNGKDALLGKVIWSNNPRYPVERKWFTWYREQFTLMFQRD